ncbi:MAG TPA: glycosyltransferase family 87 protein [Planctomycetota bacterium]|nr:glycosyltransferase family 87 protein [Planctomycetota bacterium]
MTAAEERPPPVRTLLALALGLALGAFLFEGVVRPVGGGFKGFIDFAPYYRGAVALRRGENPYDLGTTDAIGRERRVPESEGFRYLYPPTFGLLAAPLGLLPYQAAKAVWFVLQLALVAGAALLLPGAVVPRPGREDRLLVGFCFATFLPVLETIERGQVNLLLLFLLVLALRDVETGRSLRAGLAVGLATAIKGTPALLLPLFAVRRQWRAFAAGLASASLLLAGGFAVAPPGSWESFRRLVLPWYARGHAWVANQSPQGFLLRLFLGSTSEVSPDALDPATGRAATIARIVALLALAVTAIVVLRGRRAGLPLVYGLVLAAIPLATAITWVHHLVLLLPAFAALFLVPRAKGSLDRPSLPGIAAFALVALGLGYDHPAMRTPLLLPLVSTKLLGTILLWFLLLRAVLASHRAAEDRFP